MFTPAQIKVFQRALATADKHRGTVEALEEIAKHAPQFADRVSDLRTHHDNVRTLASTALIVSGNQPG